MAKSGSNADAKSKKSISKGGDAAASNVVDETPPRRPGSAISQQFMPKKQQNAVNAWRKQQQQQKQGDQQQQNYVPFKSAPLPIYGIRATPNGSVTNGNASKVAVSAAGSNPKTVARIQQYLNSTYAPPQTLRADSALGGAVGANQRMASSNIVPDSRPGSELEMFRTPSRYQSYTTLPRPEHVEVEEFRNNHFIQQQQHQQHHQQQHLQPGYYAQQQHQQDAIYGGYPTRGGKPTTRPPSALSGTAARMAYAGYDQSAAIAGIYGFAAPPPPPPPLLPVVSAIGLAAESGNGSSGYVADEVARLGLKSVVNWYILSVSAYLQILFGFSFIGIGFVRMMLRFEHAKGIEFFYGISVLMAGVMAMVAARQRSYSLAVTCFLHSVINALFFFLPLFSGLSPWLTNAFTFGGLSGGSSATSAKSYARIFSGAERGNTTAAHLPFGGGGASFSAGGDSFEMNMALLVLSLLEFVTALVTTIHGCKAGGAVILHVESERVRHYATSPHYNVYGDGGYPTMVAGKRCASAMVMKEPM